MTVAYLPHILNRKAKDKDKFSNITFREIDWKKRSPDLRDFVEKLL